MMQPRTLLLTGTPSRPHRARRESSAWPDAVATPSPCLRPGRPGETDRRDISRVVPSARAVSGWAQIDWANNVSAAGAAARFRSLPDLHPCDQTVLHFVDVLNHLIAQHAAREVTDGLTDIGHGAAGVVRREALRLDVWGDLHPLSGPILSGWPCRCPPSMPLAQSTSGCIASRARSILRPLNAEYASARMSRRHRQ